MKLIQLDFYQFTFMKRTTFVFSFHSLKAYFHYTNCFHEKERCILSLVLTDDDIVLTFGINNELNLNSDKLHCFKVSEVHVTRTEKLPAQIIIHDSHQKFYFKIIFRRHPWAIL